MPTVITYPGVFGPYSPITFTRASTATYFDSTGTLTTAATNAPRLDYNPSTLAARGLLIEEARTNSIRNSTMQGAVIGSPGTIPTTWQLLAPLGVTRRITLPIVSGVQCIDINFSGTTTTNDPIEVTPDGLATVASNGQSWSGSAWVQVVQDDPAITSTSYETWLFDGLNAFLNTGAANNFYSTRTSFTRRIISQTLADPSVAGIKSYFRTNVIPSGTILNFTLRIGLPQLELGAFATSVIPTTTTALTRAADVASVNTLSPWYNSASGTLFSESFVQNAPSVSSITVSTLSDNTTSNQMRISTGIGSGGNLNFQVSEGGVTQAQLVFGSLTTPSIHKLAGAYQINNFAACMDGGSVLTDVSGNVPVVNRLYIGLTSNGISSGQQWIRRITYYPRALSSAELVSLTS